MKKWMHGIGAFLVLGWMLSPMHVHARPNVIFIIADDLGYGDLGCYGQTTEREGV